MLTQLKFIFFFITITLSGFLALCVYFKNRKSATNKLFAWMSLFQILWVSNMFVSTASLFPAYYLILARFTLFFSTPFTISFFLFSLTVPTEYLKINKIKLFGLISCGILMMILAISPYSFVGVTVVDGVKRVVPGFGMLLTGGFQVLMSVLALYNLFRNSKNKTGVEKKQVQMVLYGALIMFGLIIFTIFLPVFFVKNDSFVMLTPLYVFIFLFFTAIAILKYKLFNLKLLATQGFALLLGFILFIQLFIFDFKGAVISRLMNFSVPQNLELLFGLLALLLCVYLGFTVIIKNHKSATSWLFFILTLVLDSYIAINYLSLHPPGGAETQLFWIRLVMFVCSFIGPALFLLAYNFPADRFLIRAKYYAPVLILALVSASVSLLPLVFTDLQFPGGRPLPTPGLGMPLFLLDFVGLFVASFILLVYKYKKSADEAKRPLGFFTAGVILTFSLMALTTVISVVFFKSSALVFAGPISSVLLVAFVAYAIIKHHIFNIKILAVEFFVALIAVILIAEGAASGAVGQSVFKLLFALLVCFLGFFLVRGVRREIEQEREITRLSALAESNRRLQVLDKQKTEFLNIAAHQLRTPTSVVNNYLAMIKDGDYGVVGAELKPVMDNIEASNQWLIKLADKLLYLSKIEQGDVKYHFEQCDLISLVKKIIAEFVPLVEEKGLRITLVGAGGHPPVFIECDEEKIKLAVFNLLDNAVRYSETGEIRVEMEESERDHPSVPSLKGGEGQPRPFQGEGGEGSRQSPISGVAIRVIDQGIGFAPEDKEKFFHKFQRGANAGATNVHTSTGLGLYLVRKFVEGHKGYVWAKSEGMGKGSEFGMWLPKKQ